MLRDVDINKISDGKIYHSGDMVKLPGNECRGCFTCCHDMGDSIILDPWDIYQLSVATGLDFNSLSEDYLGLRVVDGLIMPHLRMNENRTSCGFLNDEGRCSVHEYRPGFCRLFPLGRLYEDGGFSYFLQKEECNYSTFTKTKIKKWMGIPNLGEYEKYILHFHDLRSKLTEEYFGCEDKKEEDEDKIKRINMLFLKVFYLNPYDTNNDFYEEYYARVRLFLNSIRIND